MFFWRGVYKVHPIFEDRSIQVDCQCFKACTFLVNDLIMFKKNTKTKQKETLKKKQKQKQKTSNGVIEFIQVSLYNHYYMDLK